MSVAERVPSSPLAALKVQTEVAQLSLDDPEGRKKALDQLHQGLDRATAKTRTAALLTRLGLDALADRRVAGFSQG